MNILDIHQSIIDDYASYITSFINIRDEEIRHVVETKLNEGSLWPEPLIQFNPSFKTDQSVTELIDAEILAPQLHDTFRGYRLYQHQVEAITLGSKGQNFVVTSGTGSGKSLTYIGTIFNRFFQQKSYGSGVKAIIVYPMNALINSQGCSILVQGCHGPDAG